MNPELAGYTLNRSNPELVLPSNSFEEVHARFSPSHWSPLCTLITPRVPDLVIAGGPFEIIEVGHTRVSKTIQALKESQSVGPGLIALIVAFLGVRPATLIKQLEEQQSNSKQPVTEPKHQESITETLVNDQDAPIP